MSEALFDFFLPSPAPSALEQLLFPSEFVRRTASNSARTAVRPLRTKRSPLTVRGEPEDRVVIFARTLSRLVRCIAHIEARGLPLIRHHARDAPRLARRARRMEIGFFDDPENTSAALTTTLAKQTQVVANIRPLGRPGARARCARCSSASAWRSSRAGPSRCVLGAVPILAAAMSIMMKMMLTDEDTGGGGARAHRRDRVRGGAQHPHRARVPRGTPTSCGGSRKLAVITHTKTGESLQAAWSSASAWRSSSSCTSSSSRSGRGRSTRGICDGEQMFKALFSIMFGASARAWALAFLAEAEKAKIASDDMFALLDRTSAIDAMQAESGGSATPAGSPRTRRCTSASTPCASRTRTAPR